MTDSNAIVAMSADIVVAYAGQSGVPVAELPALLKSVHDALAQAAHGSAATPPAAKPAPATTVRKSITPAFLVCLDCGKRHKSMKRHLLAAHNLSPAAYRSRWELPFDYPMVAPDYAAARSALALANGLGRGAKVGGRTRSKGAPSKRGVKAKSK